MRTNLAGVVIGLLLSCCAVLGAEPVLSVRLVKASSTGDGVDQSIQDVAGLLRENLVFKSYTLVAAQRVGLPAHAAAVVMGGYSVLCDGTANRLQIMIRQGNRPLVNTTVSFKSGKPIILGGFPARDGRLIFVFVAGE
jgi:hypothetical protein